MLHGSTHPGVAGSELNRLLARLAAAPPPDGRPAFAERLGHWLGWTGAISLSAALNAAPAAPVPGRSGGTGREEADFQRVHAALAASIAAGHREPGASPTDFAPYRRHCLALQQAMQDTIGALRQRLRDALAQRSAAGARLAAIDAVMDKALAAQERGLLGLVPLRLQAHFERLQRSAGDDARWPEVFRDDMDRVLLAELAHRLLPAQGLLDSLHTRPTDMNRTFQIATAAAFAAGLIVIAWVGAGYIPGNPLALALVLLIGAFYGAGTLELRRFQQATASLAQRLGATKDAPPALGPWLAALHPSLHNAVRLRIEGERIALPGPALTPYLAGLLVLLGMLGTFLGMVVTLKGTGLALETATDLDAIRATLAAPVKGLGLAFGTSVAGVAASAMLGLMSALARRERQRAAQQLDAHIATTLRGFSRAHQREESLRLLRVQAEAMPALVEQLQGLVAQLAVQGQSLQDRLVANQAQFHGEAQRAYTGLAESVDRSLQTSLAESARLAGAAIEPAVQATMAGLARESTTLREVLAGAVQQQLDGVTARLDHTAAVVLDGVTTRMDRHAGLWTEAWRETLAQQRQDHAALAQHTNASLATLQAGFEQHAAALLRSVGEAHAAWDANSSAAMAERQQQICTTLQATAQAITAQAEAHARATIGEITRLVQTASEAPRAAAEVIGELRSALSDSLVRDNAALDERNRLLATLSGLLDAVEHAGTEQRAAIDALVQATTEVLDRVGTRFADTVEAESRTLRSVAAQVSGSAAEVASLGEGFGVAVNLFGQTSERLAAQLQAIESALGQSMARSDEQLAYYVAQAREIIDLTLGSQKQIVEDLQRLGRAPAEAEAA